MTTDAEDYTDCTDSEIEVGRIGRLPSFGTPMNHWSD